MATSAVARIGVAGAARLGVAVRNGRCGAADKAVVGGEVGVSAEDRSGGGRGGAQSRSGARWRAALSLPIMFPLSRFNKLT